MQKLRKSMLKTVPAPKSEDTCFEDTDPPHPFPEPSQEESDRDFCVHRIDHELTLVCRDDDACYHGSHALALLSQRCQLDLLPISRQQAANLRARLQIARDALLPFFADADQRHVTAGLASAEKFVAWWALSKEQRASQRALIGWEHTHRVRWLQNALHNFSILDDLDGSASARRNKVVATIKTNSGACK